MDQKSVETIRTQILEELAGIEKARNVRILYACESGSRAWGFPSKDSDYDVRFIYVQQVDSYLSIQDQPDVIERPIDHQLDIVGWDLRKALQLFLKSNPPLLEWLGSPIVYREFTDTAARLRDLRPVYYSPKACMFHYLHMAQGNFRDYLHGDRVWLKKYFYVLRPLLAIEWIERGKGVAPTEFDRLVDELIEDPKVLFEVKYLIDRKAQGAELDYGDRLPELSGFIESTLHRLETLSTTLQSGSREIAPLDEAFRLALRDAWA